MSKKNKTPKQPAKVAGLVDVPATQSYTPLQTPEAIKLRDMGKKVQESLLDMATRYMELCGYIRKVIKEGKLTLPQVRQELKSVGYSESRVSELNRVATAADDVYDKYISGQTGFKAALTEAREETTEHTAPQAAAMSPRKKVMKALAAFVKALNNPKFKLAKGETEFSEMLDGWLVVAGRQTAETKDTPPKGDDSQE